MQLLLASDRRSLRSAVFIVLWMVAGLACGRAQAQDQDPTRFLYWAYQDAGALVRDVSTHAPLMASGGVAILVPTSQFDALLQGGVRESYSGVLASYLDLTNRLGGSYVKPAVAGLFAVSLATDDERFQDAAFTSLQALVYANIITKALKKTFGRSRPSADSGAYQFSPFSGSTSFPSGHTTTAFAVVTPWVLYYPNVATYGLFALSTGTAVARMALDKHWPTDVLAGAAVGFFTARYLTRRHQTGHAGVARLSVSPAVGPGGRGLVLRFRFD